MPQLSNTIQPQSQSNIVNSLQNALKNENDAQLPTANVLAIPYTLSSLR